MDVYAAGKSQAEATSWEFMKTTKPGFVFNAGKDGAVVFAGQKTNGYSPARCELRDSL